VRSGEGSWQLLGRSCPGLHISTGVAQLSSHSRVVSSPILPFAARSLRLQCNPVPVSTFITVAPSASIVSRPPIPITPTLRPRRRRLFAE